MQFYWMISRWYKRSFAPWFFDLPDFMQNTFALCVSAFCYLMGGLVMLFSVWLQMPSNAYSGHANGLNQHEAHTDSSEAQKNWKECKALDKNNSFYVNKDQLILSESGRLVRPKTDFSMRFKPNAKAKNFWHDFAYTLKQREVKFTFLPISPRGLLKDYATFAPKGYSVDKAQKAWDKFVRDWKKNDVDMIDLVPSLHSLGINGALLRDHHWSPKAAKLAAKALAEHLLQDEMIRDLPKESFNLSGEELTHMGGFALQYTKVCGVEPPLEQITHWQSEWQTEDLFADMPPAVIAVTGASNLNSQFGFVANLRHALQLPVDNYNVSGGGFHHGILNVFSQPTDQPLPYWLVWVVPGYQSEIYKFKDQHREIIVAAQGQCNMDNAISYVDGELIEDELVFNIKHPDGPDGSDGSDEITEQDLSSFNKRQKGAIYAQFTLPKDADGRNVWPSNKSVDSVLSSDQGVRWKHKFLRKRNGLELFSLPLPTKLAWKEMRLSLSVKSTISPRMYICRSQYLAHWSKGLSFSLENQITSSDEKP